MKNCLECGIEFDPKRQSFEKYCNHYCCIRANRKKRTERLRVDPEFRKKKNEYEKNRIEKVGRSRDRLKHNAQEKERYRKKHGIDSDSDLRCKPKGSGTLTRYGYRQITKKDHPNSNRNGTMFEHVHVMSEYLERPLMKGETVHHKNGIRHDNRIENLELWSKSHPSGQRVEDKIQWCKQFLEEYGHKVIMKEIK